MIKGKPGNMTRGVTKETLDGISMDFFTKLSEALPKGKFNFTPTRRIMIPKGPGKTGERPLSIANPREKIAQKAIALILETIYEPKFSENSHGFRPNRGVHTALKQLHIQGGTYTWVINGDISKCFDKIPHDKIMKLLAQHISCHRTLELIKKSLINPAMLGKKIIPSHQGTPQGSIISPVISNIVLHELDSFCDNLKKSFDIGRARKVNPKYHSLGSSRYKSKNPTLRANHLKRMMNMPAKDTQDPNFRRLLYVRYADDFLLLLISSQSEAFTIKRKISDFLKNHLQLELNASKTTIANVKDGFEFLGAHVIQRGTIIAPVRRAKGTKEGITLIYRSRHVRRLSVLAPLEKIIQKMINLGFARRNHLGTLSAKSRRDLVNLSHYEILSFYNSRIRGTLNFYSFAGNYSHLRKIWWIYAQSCAITIALKYKTKTMRKAFLKFGKNLKDPNSDTELYSEKSMKVKQ
jgi:group II intron reverse transcriptase/maturase